MPSIYTNKNFAQYWNKRAGETGEIYKRLILDPIMFKTVSNFKGKNILELGCGNGYLGPRFLSEKPKSLTLMDISKYNLEFAKAKCTDPKVRFVQQDATKKWSIKSNTMDIIYSNMMLNEIKNIETAIREAFRVLRKGGIFIFSVTHPSWDLFVFAQEKLGNQSNKIQGLGGYFRRGFAKYLMGIDSDKNPELHEKFGDAFKVEHYQRPLSDYFNRLTEAGFSVKNIFEPELTKELLKQSPRFSEYRDHPVGLIFYAIKLK